jgi:Ca2+-binding RTX toxin-like protein
MCVARLPDDPKGLSMRRTLIALCFSAVVVGTGLVGQAGAQDPVMCRGEVATKVGTPGVDRMIGTPGVDVIAGLAGDDVIVGQAGEDLICGGDGDDFINGSEDDDELWGDNGDDFVFGGSGNDRMFGNFGNDHLYGQDGDDNQNCGTDIGGGDVDFVDGGSGLDGELFCEIVIP